MLPRNFGGLPPELDNPVTAAFTVLPFPYEATVSWGGGTGGGPEALLAASRAMELHDEVLGRETCEVGIHTAEPIEYTGDPEAMPEAVLGRFRELVAPGRTVVTLGGEHSVTLPAIMAHREVWPDLCVLQLDAHTDLRQSYDGLRMSHAAVMRRVLDLDPELRLVQVGIRSSAMEERVSLAEKRVSTFWAWEHEDPSAVADRVLERLRGPVYLTVDLDVFDPAVVPATGTPEPGGYFWHPVDRFLRRVIAEKQVVGFDVVELAEEDSAAGRASAFLAARLCYRLMGYVAKRGKS